MVKRDAVELALDLYRHPIKVQAARKAALPKDVLKLIRIVSGSDEELAALALPDIKSPIEMREAAAFFMQQVMFQTGNPPHRILGLPADADAQLTKDHKRLLLKWLHPDRNQNKWERVYFQRVMRAAETLEEGPGKSLIVSETQIKPSPPSHKAKIKLHAMPNTKNKRRRFRLWLKRGFYLAAILLLALIGFSVMRHMGYIADDLPWLNQLRDWLR